MKRVFLAILFFVSVSAYGQHERLIVFGSSPLFNFDPISGSYRSGSLAQLSSYIEAWRAEEDIDNVLVSSSDNFFKSLPYGYQLYHQSKDSTLINNIFTFLNVTKLDTTKFNINKYHADTLYGRKILVVDRWDFFGDVTTEAKVVDIGDFPPSSKYLEKFSRNQQEIRHFFSSPIAVLPKDFSTRNMYFGPSDMANLLHNFQLTFGDVSSVAPAKFDKTWKAGNLYIKDIYDLFTYDNDLNVITATGSQLKQFMEDVYGDRYFTYRRPTDDLVRIKTPYFYHDGFAGVEFEVNVSNNKGKRIQNHNIDLNKSYKIVTNSFRTKWFIDNGCKVENFGQYRILFIKWLMQNSISGIENVEKWTIVPNANINQTIERELKSIF